MEQTTERIRTGNQHEMKFSDSTQKETKREPNSDFSTTKSNTQQDVN
jgi:hypothetical protein